jgi:cellulose synthase/poly-beta-1,6-N-acetylglucosamine synthase-like glycosyltransferase
VDNRTTVSSRQRDEVVCAEILTDLNVGFKLISLEEMENSFQFSDFNGGSKKKEPFFIARPIFLIFLLLIVILFFLSFFPPLGNIFVLTQQVLRSQLALPSVDSVYKKQQQAIQFRNFRRRI